MGGKTNEPNPAVFFANLLWQIPMVISVWAIGAIGAAMLTYSAFMALSKVVSIIGGL